MHLAVFLSQLIFTASVTRAVQFISSNLVSNAAREAIETPGDILIGGLFPVYSGLQNSSWKQCSKLNPERGIHRLEAMMYAVDMINKDRNILPNHTIGVNIRDTCGSDTHALEESIHFIKGLGGVGSKCGSSGLQSTLFGVVGAASSGVSMQVANLLRLFQIPQISYASTSPDLNDRQKYDFFFRTVPPDTYQARAMIDVIRYFEWTSVFGMYSSGNYGTKGMEVFEKLAEANNICMVRSFLLNGNTNFKSIFDQMEDFPGTRVVVLFLTIQDLSELLTAVKRAKRNYRFKWVASDYWGTRRNFIVDRQLQDAAQGAITLTPQTVKVAGFEQYFQSLTPTNNKRNPWFPDFWEKYHGCSLSNKSSSWPRRCVGNETLRKNDKLDDKIPYVIDAVYAFAHAINMLVMRHCGGAECRLSNLTGQTLLDVLRGNFSFVGELDTLKFDENGSTVRAYEINELVVESGLRYKKLGSWSGGLTVMKATVNVTSSCSDTCQTGQIKVPKKAGVKCCFICRDCGVKQFVEKEIYCRSCKASEIPNGTRTGCEQLPEVPINSAWVVAMMTLSSVGIIATFLVILVFMYYNNTAVVKASARELSYPLLVGIVLCYLLPFFLLSEPTEISCGIVRFGFGFSFFVCYASLVTKTIRIERIFKLKTPIQSHPRVLLRPSSQLLILMMSVLLEILLALIGLFLRAPNSKIFIDETKGQKIKLCVLPLYDIVVAFGCNILLIMMCTVFAFRTRKVPACFNEAKYIGFVMYTTCVLWLAFVTIYFGLSFNYVIIALCMNIFLSATSILAGVFGPKIYIIIFRPGRNNRSRSGLTIRHVYSNESFAAEPTDISRKMTTLTSLNVEATTQTESIT